MKRILATLWLVVAFLFATPTIGQTIDARQSSLTLPSTGLRVLPHSGTGCPASGTWLIYTVAVGTDGTLCFCAATGTPGTWVDVTGDVGVNVTTMIETPQCSEGPFVYPDGSDNDVDVSYPLYDATDHQIYRVITSNSDDDDIEVGECFCVPPVVTAFHATTAATLTYKLSDGSGGNGVKLRVRGTDGSICYTSSAGTSTSSATLTATASDLASCVKASGGLVCVSAVLDTLDNTDTASIGLITLKMVE